MRREGHASAVTPTLPPKRERARLEKPVDADLWEAVFAHLDGRPTPTVVFKIKDHKPLTHVLGAGLSLQDWKDRN